MIAIDPTPMTRRFWILLTALGAFVLAMFFMARVQGDVAHGRLSAEQVYGWTTLGLILLAWLLGTRYLSQPQIRANQLVQAVVSGDPARVQAALRRRVDVDRPGYQWTALGRAAYDGRPILCKLLLEAGADPNCAFGRGWTPLLAAATNGDVETFRLLVESGARLDIRTQPLSPEERLRFHDITVDGDLGGCTVLMFAVGNCGVAIVEDLIARGVDLEAEAEFGLTALILGAVYGQTVCVRRLLAAGANKEHRSASGLTPLMYAAIWNRQSTAMELLANGVEVDARDPEGRTALMIAALHRHRILEGLLLDAGADPALTCNEGLTAADYRQRDRKEVDRVKWRVVLKQLLPRKG